MAVTKKRKIGDTGEEIATKYLLNKGFSVIERNYWKPWGEIDIVAEKGGVVRFMEVKSVSADLSSKELSRGTLRPEENLHEAKLKRLYRAIQTYLAGKHIPDSKQWQIDLACVFLDFDLKKARVELMENIIL